MWQPESVFFATMPRHRPTQTLTTIHRTAAFVIKSRNDPGYAKKKKYQFINDFSLVGSAVAPDVQSSVGTLKVTQQLHWTLMGDWGAVLHITGPLPLQRKRF